jgi:hypothetical protein
VRRSSIASSSPLWLAAVRPDPKDDVQYAAHQQRQAAAVDHAEVAAALCEASSAFRRWIYAAALDSDPAATLDDLREAVATLEDTARTARRVLSGAHPLTVDIERELRIAQAVLRPRETPLRAQEDK